MTNLAAAVERKAYFISGPSASATIYEMRYCEGQIAALCMLNGDDTDEYTCTEISEHPPVAGLAELRKFGYVLRTGHGDIFREEKPECEIDKWVAVYVPNTEAAREFLGKVDG